MKILKKIIVFISIAFFLTFASCKNNETANHVSDSLQKDSIVTVKPSEAKDTTVSTHSDKLSCIAKSDFSLPYNQKIDLKKVIYAKLNCKISGIEEFLCGESNLRYISLPDFENNKVILVPMDCGDFNYRFILLTIFENKVVSNQYVEGEWSEPGDDSYKEVTSFKIDQDYVITITTNAVENNTTSLKSSVKLKIRDDGTFDKL